MAGRHARTIAGMQDLNSAIMAQRCKWPEASPAIHALVADDRTSVRRSSGRKLCQKGVNVTTITYEGCRQTMLLLMAGAARLRVCAPNNAANKSVARLRAVFLAAVE
jgi:hypothetical protein